MTKDSLESFLQSQVADMTAVSHLRSDRQQEGCAVEFSNETPCDWQAKITQIGAKFWFQDEDGNLTDDEVVGRGTSLNCGSREALYSRDSCVRLVLASVFVYVDGEEKLFSLEEDSGSPDECLLSVSFALAPRIASLADSPTAEKLKLIRKYK